MKSIKLLVFALLLWITSTKAQFITPDTIPVIIHVIHNNESVGSGHNLDAVQLMSQFPILNNDFAGQGWNVQNVPAVWSLLIANTQMVFVPAMVDTNGNALAEPGIDRIDRTSRGWSNTATMNSASLQSYLDNTIKPQSIWNTSQYCNVWVLDMSASGLLGYSTFPANSGLPWITGAVTTPTNDGVVIHYKCWGDTLNVMAPYNHGRTATHEMGHWMGLIHMYGGCAQQAVTDVPVGKYNQWFSSPVFPDVADTCAGYPDGPMFMNFMCYAISDSDVYMFTDGQANAMRQAMTNSRPSVLNSPASHTTGLKSYNDFTGSITIYPNPSNGVFTINSTTETVLEVLDIMGSVILRSTTFSKNHHIDLSNHARGVYFIRFKTAYNGVVTKSVNKE